MAPVERYVKNRVKEINQHICMIPEKDYVVVIIAFGVYSRIDEYLRIVKAMPC